MTSDRLYIILRPVGEYFTLTGKVITAAHTGKVTAAGEGLLKVGLCSALKAFEQGGIFIVLYLL